MVSELTPADEESLPAELPSMSEDQTLAIFCHLGGLFTWIIVPLIIWLVRKEQSEFVGHHGKEAVNYQLTQIVLFIVVSVISGVVWLVAAMAFEAKAGIVLGFVTWFSLAVVAMLFEIVFVILASVAASRGRWYRYPGNIRFIQ